jgi:hypothetical protein
VPLFVSSRFFLTTTKFTWTNWTENDKRVDKVRTPHKNGHKDANAEYASDLRFGENPRMAKSWLPGDHGHPRTWGWWARVSFAPSRIFRMILSNSTIFSSFLDKRFYHQIFGPMTTIPALLETKFCVVNQLPIKIYLFVHNLVARNSGTGGYAPIVLSAQVLSDQIISAHS